MDMERAADRPRISSLVDDSDFDGLADLDDRIHRDPHGLVMDHDQMYWFSRQVVPKVVTDEFVAAGSPDALPGPNNSNEWVGEPPLPDCSRSTAPTGSLVAPHP